MIAHRGCVIWLTGLSGAGKSTIANALGQELQSLRVPVEILDGDIVRETLCHGLGFSKEDRDENIRRIGFVAQLLSRNGVTVIVAAISPYRAAREDLRRTIPDFIEVYVECPLDVLMDRDTKGLYRRALAGEIDHFTGVSDPYEGPLSPNVVIHSAVDSVRDAVQRIREADSLAVIIARALGLMEYVI